MRQWDETARAILGGSRRGFWGLVVLSCAGYAGGADLGDRADGGRGDSVRGGVGIAQQWTSRRNGDLAERLSVHARWVGSWLLAWYRRTPPPERATWGGLAASAGLGWIVLLERLVRLRRRRVMPAAFTARFLDRLHEGKLDCGQALDHCERNPSPAARVALAAVRRWGRPAADLERAVTMAHRVEIERLRRNVGTLRRIAVLAPILGLLGTLLATGRALEALPPASSPGGDAPNAWILHTRLSPPTAATAGWGPALAVAIQPLTSGLFIAILALVAYDGVVSRVEKLSGALDRLGVETIEAVALSAPIVPPRLALSARASRPDAPKPGPVLPPRARPEGTCSSSDRT